VKYKEIAEIANVSVATVSLVLNNKPGISDATRHKILEIAKSLSESSQHRYPLSRLKKGAIRFVRIVKHGHTLNRDHDVFISAYIEGMESEARKNGYNLEVSTFKTNDLTTIFELFNDLSIDGYIVLGTELNSDDIAILANADAPIVFIDTYFDFQKADFVDMNNIEEVFQIVKYLHDKHHRRIGMVRSNIEVKNFELRDIGFKKALQHFKIPNDEKSIFTVDSTFDGAYHDMVDHLKKNRWLPTALFVVNDITAYGCIKALKNRGFSVPDDVSIVGFDDLPMSALMDPPLTTMKVSNKRIGRYAMRLMIERIEKDGALPSTKVTIGGELIERKSVKDLELDNSYKNGHQSRKIG
jgi:LacI family transcriptional regulator